MILRADWLYPVAGPLVRDGFVEISGTRIVRCGPADQCPRGAALEDCGAAIIMPGLINPHTHLELTGYYGQLPPEPFWPWIVQLIALRSQPGQVSRERAGVAEGAWQSLRAGVTCVGDISRTHLAWEVLRPLPIRKVCFAELLTIAADPPRDPDELRTAVEATDEDDLLTAGVSPHAPYTVPPDQVREAIHLAARRNRPWTMHLAETPEEVALLAGDPSGLPDTLIRRAVAAGVQINPGSVADYVAENCAAAAGALVHMNYLDDANIARLADMPHTVIYCPRAHHFFGHRAHPLGRLLAAGVRVSIGTDSLASNDSLSILDELAFIRRHVDRTISATRLLEMVTRDAAAALGLDEHVGTLEAGKCADLAVFPCRPAATDPLDDLIDEAPRPLAVYVAGARVPL